MYLKKVLVLFLFNLIILVFTVSAQQAKLNWLADAKSYLNGGYISVQDIAVDTDNSVIAVGNFERNADFDPGPDTFNLEAVSEQDIFIAKYTAAGKLIYAYSFGGASNLLIESAYAVTIDKQGNSYITGTFGKTIDFDPGPGEVLLSAPTSNEIFIVSFTSDGKLRYAKNIADNNGSNAVQTGKSIAVDDDQNIYIAGNFSGKNVDFDPGPAKALFSAQGPLNVFFAKYDKYGKYVYAKPIYGNDRDEANKLTLDHDNNIILCGKFRSYKNDFDPGPDSAQVTTFGRDDIFLAKYDVNGNYIFAHCIGSSYFDEATTLRNAGDNSIIIAGRFQRTVDFDPGPAKHELTCVGSANIFFARYDKNGNYLYAHSLESSTYDECFDIAVTKENNFTLVGEMSGSYNADFNPRQDSSYILPGPVNGFFAEYTVDGNFITASSLRTGLIRVNSISLNTDEDFIVGGTNYGRLDSSYAYDSASQGNTMMPQHMVITHLNKNGKYKSSFSSGAYENYYNAETQITNTATDAQGNIYTCGLYEGRFDFDPGPGTLILESQSYYQSSGFFAKYNKDGKLVFAKSLTGVRSINDIAIDEDHNIYIVGNADKRTDFDPSKTVFNLPYKNAGYFIAKYDVNGNYVYAKGENTNGYTTLKAIEISSNNNLCIAGYFSIATDFDPSSSKYILKPTGSSDAFISLYTASGDFVFVKQIGGINSSCGVTDLKLTKNNSFVIAGDLSGTSVDFDPGAATYLLSGKSTHSYISKYSAQGNFQLAFGFEKTNNNYFDQEVTALTVDTSDNMYIAGISVGTIDFDPGIDTFSITNYPIDDFFASYDSAGKFRYARNFKIVSVNPDLDYISSIVTDKDKNLYIAANLTSERLDINPGFDSVILVNEAIAFNEDDAELFIAVYDSSGNYLAHHNYNLDSAFEYNIFSNILISNNDLIVTSNLSSKIDFDISPNTSYFIPYGANSYSPNMCIAKYSLQKNRIKNTPIAYKSLPKKDRNYFNNQTP